MKYKTKPVEIEAIQFNKVSDASVMCNAWPEFKKFAKWTRSPEMFNLSITTPEGIMTANQYDWIIKGTESEFYPVKRTVFEKKYEKV